MQSLDCVPDPAIIPRGPSPSGMYCRFVAVGDVGLKLWEGRFLRDDCYKGQKKLSEIGLAPRVGCCFEISLDNYHYYGHTTEIAETIVDSTYSKPRVQDQFEQLPYERRVELLRMFEELENDLEKAGHCFYDGHWGNVGLLNGRMVVIDCEEICTDDSEDYEDDE